MDLHRPAPVQQFDLFDDRIVIPGVASAAVGALRADTDGRRYFSAPDIDLSLYDRAVIAMSGGKDALASLLHLLEMGVDRERIELWHHDIDGREGSTLMDWHFMADYNRKLAATFGVPIYFSWLQGGFEGEMLKENSFSQPHAVETPDGLIVLPRDTTRTAPGTRRRFPQQSASLATRWCSSALKIDVGRRAITNQERFSGSRTLFVTGERRQESSNRAKYWQLEPHAVDRRDGRLERHVDAWRPVLEWSEEEVWDILRRHNIIAPVPYRLGWSRSSCMTCIYNGPRIWATLARYWPERVERIAGYERAFATTISRNRIDVIQVGAKARPFEIEDVDALAQSVERKYRLPVLVPDGGKWIMPVGAFGSEGCGAD